MTGIVTSTSAMLEERALDFTGRLGAARISAAEALETDLGKLAEARKGIEIYLNEHSRKLAESGDRMTSLIQADLQRFDESRGEMETGSRRARAQIGR